MTNLERRGVDLFLRGQGWAEDMMVSNDADFTLVDWEPFREEVEWDLPAGAGLRRVYVHLRRGSTVVESSDEILLC